MEFKLDELIEFKQCPFKYRYIKQGVKEGTDTLLGRYNMNYALNQMAIGFYKSIEKEEKFSANEIKSEFIKYFSGINNIDELIRKQNRSIRSGDSLLLGRTQRVRKVLNNFISDYSDKPGYPIITEWSFNLKLGEHNIAGSIPIIRKRENRTEIFNILDDTVKINDDIKRNYIKYHIHYLIYKNKVKELNNDVDSDPYVVLYKANESQERVIDVSKNDTDSALEELYNIISIIENDLYFKSVGKTCKQCGFVKACTDKMHDLEVDKN